MWLIILCNDGKWRKAPPSQALGAPTSMPTIMAWVVFNQIYANVSKIFHVCFISVSESNIKCFSCEGGKKKKKVLLQTYRYHSWKHLASSEEQHLCPQENYSRHLRSFMFQDRRWIVCTYIKVMKTIPKPPET